MLWRRLFHPWLPAGWRSSTDGCGVRFGGLASGEVRLVIDGELRSLIERIVKHSLEVVFIEREIETEKDTHASWLSSSSARDRDDAT